MVDMRFGPGTWKGILEERQKRIQEAKEAAMKARREAILRQEEIMENVKMALLLIFVIVVGIGAFILLMVSAASSMSVRYGY